MPAWTERNRSVFDMLTLACCKSNVKIATVDLRKEYLEARYRAPKVWPRLLDIGRHMTARYGPCCASKAN